MASQVLSEKSLYYRVPLEADGRRADALLSTYRFLREATSFAVRYVLETSPSGDYAQELRDSELTLLGSPSYYAMHALVDCFYSDIVPALRKSYEGYSIDIYLHDVFARAHYVLSRRGLALLRGLDIVDDDLLLDGYSSQMNYVVVGSPPVDYIFGRGASDGRFVLPTIVVDGDEAVDVFSRPVYYLKFSPLPPLHDFMRFLHKISFSDLLTNRHFFRLYSVGGRWYLSYRLTEHVYRELLHTARGFVDDPFVSGILRRLGTALLVKDIRRTQSLIEDPLVVASREHGEMLFPSHRFRASLAEHKRSVSPVERAKEEDDGDECEDEGGCSE